MSAKELIAAGIGGGYAWSATSSSASTTSDSFATLPGSSVTFTQRGEDRGVIVRFTGEVVTGSDRNILLRAVIPGVQVSPSVFLGRSPIAALETRTAEFVFHDMPPGDHDVVIHWLTFNGLSVSAWDRSKSFTTASTTRWALQL